MPRIAKGAKYVFGWSKIRDDGTIVIPDEAFEEYGLKADSRVILVSGSKTSGGFGITSRRLLEGSPLRVVLTENPELDRYLIPEGNIIKFKGRYCCWACLDDKRLKLGNEPLEAYGARVGDRLLSIRSSDIAMGMAVKGPIIEEARKHQQIEVY